MLFLTEIVWFLTKLLSNNWKFDRVSGQQPGSNTSHLALQFWSQILFHFLSLCCLLHPPSSSFSLSLSLIIDNFVQWNIKQTRKCQPKAALVHFLSGRRNRLGVLWIINNKLQIIAGATAIEREKGGGGGGRKSEREMERYEIHNANEISISLSCRRKWLQAMQLLSVSGSQRGMRGHTREKEREGRPIQILWNLNPFYIDKCNYAHDTIAMSNIIK